MFRVNSYLLWLAVLFLAVLQVLDFALADKAAQSGKATAYICGALAGRSVAMVSVGLDVASPPEPPECAVERANADRYGYPVGQMVGLPTGWENAVPGHP